MRLIRLALALLVTGPALAQSPPAPASAPADPGSLAEPPNWPLGYMLPPDLAPAPDASKPPPKGPVKADLLVWIPPKAQHVRALFIVPNNTDSKDFTQYAPFREVCAKHEMAIVYLRNFETGIEGETSASDPTRMEKLLAYLAEKTGHPEFRHAPWITFGKSSRSRFPYRTDWLYPDRMIASVTYHGETPVWPVPEWAKLKDQTILHVNANGDTEWGGTWYNHVRPSLLNYRAKYGWLAHQVVARDVGHGDYVDAAGSPGWGKPFPDKVTCIRVWDYLSKFIDKALALRVPTDRYPIDGPLTLKRVDESTGLLIDPFAVEETFGVPHLPLHEKDGVYVLGGGAEPPVSGFLALTPLPDFNPPADVPVVQPEPGKSPSKWLITDSLKFAMAADPMVELGDLAKLMPKPGDSVTIDGKPLTFQPIDPKHVAANGGIALNKGLRPPNAKITLLAYTVLEFTQPTVLRVQAGYTAATRIQLVINGIPVRNKQVLSFAPGKYPLLVVLRMTANWERIEPNLGAVPPAEVDLAKQMQAEVDAAAAAMAKAKASGAPPRVLIRKASEVPAAERARMFWLPDQELADEWLKLHTPPAKK